MDILFIRGKEKTHSFSVGSSQFFEYERGCGNSDSTLLIERKKTTILPMKITSINRLMIQNLNLKKVEKVIFFFRILSHFLL